MAEQKLSKWQEMKIIRNTVLMLAVSVLIFGFTYVMVSGGYINFNFESGDTRATITTGQVKQ